LKVSDRTLVEDLQRLVAPDTRRDPESPLRWCSTARTLTITADGEGVTLSV
jgi:hypothetical protein